MEKRESSYAVGGTISWYNYYEEQYGSSLKTKNRCTIWPSNATPGRIPGENHSAKWYVHPNVIAALFTTAKIWKQPKCPPTDEWIKKMWRVWLYHPHFTRIKKQCPREASDLAKGWTISVAELRHSGLQVSFHIYSLHQDSNQRSFLQYQAPRWTTAPFQCLPPEDDESSSLSQSGSEHTVPILHLARGSFWARLVLCDDSTAEAPGLP